MKANNENSKDQKDSKIVISVITVSLTALAVTIAALTYKLNSDDNDSKRKKEESDILTQSINCSLSNCGIKQCIDIYTTRYPKGEYIPNAIQASESGKSAPACFKKEDTGGNVKGNTGTTYNQTTGVGSPIVSGNGNFFTLDGRK